MHGSISRRGVRRSIILCVLCFAMPACEQNELIILTNATTQPIRLRYSVPTFRADVGAPPRCTLRVWPPQVRPTPADNAWPASEWRTADAKLDQNTCEAELVLEAGSSALLDRNGFCDDHARYSAVGAAYRPSFNSLLLQSGGRTIEWRDWDTAKQFHRTRQGHCIYRVS